MRDNEKGAGVVKTEYRLPNEKLPGLSMNDHLADIRELAEWIQAAGFPTANTRIDRYTRYLEAIVVKEDGSGDGIFIDPVENPFESFTDRYLYVLREVHELMWIMGGLRLHRPKGLEPKLRSVVKGSDFAALDRDSSSRNIQFELRIASFFCREGYQVDLSTETDVVASSAKEHFYVECKRVASANQLDRRLKEAEKQLDSRLPKSTHGRRHYGVAALDVTKVAYEHNGLTWAITADHSKDMIQDKLKSISSGLSSSGPRNTNKNILPTWLQIHIPALIQHPTQFTTRFSHYFITNDQLGGTRRRAFNRLRSVLESGQIKDPREVGPAQMRFRNSIILPAGTIMAWDESLIEHFVEYLLLPFKEPEHIVLTVTVADVKQEFVFHELEHVIRCLDEETKSKLDGDKTAAMGLLAALLLGFRYPYEDKYPFDASFGSQQA